MHSPAFLLRPPPASAAPVRVYLTEDHILLGQAIIALLAGSGVTVVGHGASRAQVLADIQQGPMLLGDPQVVLMDARLGADDGIELIGHLRDLGITTPFVVLSEHEDVDTVSRAIAAGASGYLPKSCAPEELAWAVRHVAEGRSVLHPTVTDQVFDRVADVIVTAGIEQLSRREAQVLAMVAQGMTNRQIAEDVSVSEDTIKEYLKRIFKKLRVSNRHEAVSVASMRGLL